MDVHNLSLVALTPADLPTAQSTIIDWCDRKLTSITEAVTDLQANIDIARRNKWRISGALDHCQPHRRALVTAVA